MLDLPDFDAVRRDLRIRSMVTVPIAASAHELGYFAGDAAFTESQREVKFAPESFIPSGRLFEDGEDVQPSAAAFFVGHVEEALLLANPETRASFCHRVVRTLDGTVDLVADPHCHGGAVSRLTSGQTNEVYPIPPGEERP
jgi:hypothetical protein